jgi:hypothetical protein
LPLWLGLAFLCCRDRDRDRDAHIYSHRLVNHKIRSGSFECGLTSNIGLDNQTLRLGSKPLEHCKNFMQNPALQ